MALWAERSYTFQESGLSREDWYHQNESPQSTLGYWNQKIQSGNVEAEGVPDPIFAKLPMGQELDVPIHTGIPPVTILPPENIRIEIGADCLARLIAALLQALKGYV